MAAIFQDGGHLTKLISIKYHSYDDLTSQFGKNNVCEVHFYFTIISQMKFQDTGNFSRWPPLFEISFSIFIFV